MSYLFGVNSTVFTSESFCLATVVALEGTPTRGQHSPTGGWDTKGRSRSPSGVWGGN